MSPEWTEVLKYIGSGLGIVFSGMAGAKINERRNSGWDEDRDQERRVIPHEHGNNGGQKFVKESECIRNHANEKELRDNLLENYKEIKNDIRSINQILSGG